jgi:hypothetical protein
MTYSELHATEKEKGILITNEMLFLTKASTTDQLLFTAATAAHLIEEPSTVRVLTLKIEKAHICLVGVWDKQGL